MRLVLAVLLVTTAAHAESSWSEFGAAVELRPASQLAVTACDMAIDLRGAIADVQLTERLSNTGAGALGATSELLLPENAQVAGLTMRRGRTKPARAIAVATPVRSEVATADAVIGADPVLVTALPPRDGHARFRIVVQPFDGDQDVAVGIHWTAPADIRDGALTLVLPARPAPAPCRGVLHAMPGPGTRVDRILVDRVEVAKRDTASFEVGAADTELSVPLAFLRNEPVVWSQSSPLGDGLLAQTVTVATPVVKNVSARRVLFVVDGSRSMELVGRHNVKRIIDAVGTALPAQSEIEAIVFDRTAARVLGSWQPATSERLVAIQHAVESHVAGNGSDLPTALSLAHQVIGSGRDQTLIVLVTDGVLADVRAEELVRALGLGSRDVDLHAIALGRGHMRAAATSALTSTVDLLGGSHVEVSVDELDTALSNIDGWLRPAWLELSLGTDAFAIPTELRAGRGVVATSIVKSAIATKLTGHADRAISIAARSAPSAPTAELALAALAAGAIEGTLDAKLVARLRARHPSVDPARAFAVLATGGSVATHRLAMVSGGGPYTRIVSVVDPELPGDTPGSVAATGGSALDETAIKLLLMTHLKPATFVCYQRALATKPALTGTVRFTLEIGRGELTRASVQGLGDATFDACLLDAAYKVTPPLPNPDVNSDDRSIVTYPISLLVREEKAVIMAGDADSSSPIDIDKIEGGPPIVRGKVRAGDTTTPLGDLRPGPSP